VVEEPIDIDRVMLDSKGSVRQHTRRLNLSRIPSHCINESSAMNVQELMNPTYGASIFAKEINPEYESVSGTPLS
jgi:hypothetical protein